MLAVCDGVGDARTRLIENLCKCYWTFVDTNSHYANDDAKHNEIEMRWKRIKLEGTSTKGSLATKHRYLVSRRLLRLFSVENKQNFFISSPGIPPHRKTTNGRRRVMNVPSAGTVYACCFIFSDHRAHTTSTKDEVTKGRAAAHVLGSAKIAMRAK